jgi:class 3 adenylate cyclase
MAQDNVARKLTTIFATDVVGYSRMMAVDEEATLETLQTYRGVIDTLIEKHGGRIFNTAGDAVLAEFGSTVEAVRCAISIQEDLRVRNAEVPEDRQMWLRIGINVGDVIIAGDNLFGDGVNIAARLEGLAEKGGICLSGSAFEQVKNKLSIAFQDIGSHAVKNIPEPVPAYQLVPGSVDIKDTGKSAVPAASGPLSRRNGLIVAGVAIVVALGAWAYSGGLMPGEPVSEYPFDGDWKVAVSEMSGCLDNSDRDFVITIAQGKIDMSHQEFPKSGTVAPDGSFTITANNRMGMMANTQTGKLAGKSGEGRFQGREPSCTGKVVLSRLK